MKKLVTEISKASLMKLLPIFGIDSQIKISEDTETSNDNAESLLEKKPFYIEENIGDLERILSICDDVDCSGTPIRKRIESEDFFGFWEFVLNIQKQREFGCPITNIEYI
nr:hypothetical protein [Clostridiales bacterium]